MRRLSFALVLPLLAACTDSTAPDVTLSGLWAYTATNLSGSGISCSFTGLTLTISQMERTFTGTTNGGTVTCFAAGQSFSDVLGTGVIVNGTVNRSAVAFDFETPDWHHTGKANGASMSGGVTVRLDLGDPYGVLVLTGSWSAARQ